MIKLSDYIVQKLERAGVKHTFMISGGGAMHLNDSFGKSKKITYICNLHEQASAMAAEGYARVKQDLAVVCVTTGPGGINCLNGVFGQWTDSVPVLYISGQVKTSTSLSSCPTLPLRQLGDQEADIISLVKPITKFAKTVTDPYDIDAALEEAIHTAQSGRPGPVWLDIPADVQSARIDPKKLRKFKPKNPQKTALSNLLTTVKNKLENAKAPLIVAGHGIRLAKAEKEFSALLNQFNIPVVTTFNGFDSIPTKHPLFIGRIGTSGSRAGNFALQNADVILFLGTRNNIRQVSHNYEKFAKNAFKIVVDIDPAELKKPTLKPDLAVQADVKDFLSMLAKTMPNGLRAARWLAWCQQRAARYQPLNEYTIKQTGPVNAYFFLDTLTRTLGEHSVVVGANGTCCIGFFQTAHIKQGQRMFVNSGNASMGYGLPAAIGACLATPSAQTICLEGDGSVLMNLQELQTVKNYNLPLKIFILNNGGYSSIRQTQNNFFNGHLVACSRDTGVGMPDFSKIAASFGLKTERIKSNKNLAARLRKVLARKGPLVCEVRTEQDYIFAPKLSARKKPDGTLESPGLEDMFPFLSNEELKENIFQK